MAKISIEEALRNKLPLPWKVHDQSGTNFLIKRRRPEDLTNELLTQLQDFGLNIAQIKEMFYIDQSQWKIVRERLDIKAGSGKGKKKAAEPKTMSIGTHTFTVAPGRKAGKTEMQNRLAETAPKELKKVVVAPTESDAKSEYGWNDAIPDISTWAEFTGKPTGGNTGGDILSVGKKIHIGSKASTALAGWERCAILVSPDIKKVALRKSATGVKIQKPKNCSGAELSCKAATDKITASYPGPRQYRLQDATADLVIFAMEQ